MAGFSSTPSASNPAYSVSIPIVTNSGTSGSLNITNSIAVRTVKNFVINGAFIASTAIHLLDPDKPNPGDNPTGKSLLASDDLI